MIIFWGICALLILVALKWVLPPLRGTNPIAAGKTLIEANAAVYREQIADLESDLATGSITREQFEGDRRALERRALADFSAEPRPSDQRTAGSHALAVCLAIGLPVAVIVVYLALGSPEAISR